RADPQLLLVAGYEQESPDPVPGLDQPGGLQARDGFADNGAADPEGLHQRGLGRQLFADVEFAVADALGQRGHDILGEISRTAGGDGGHGTKTMNSDDS